MKKEYTIEILSVGERIKGLKPSPILFCVDKENFNDMLLLIEYVTELLTDADFTMDSIGFPAPDSLRVFADEDVLFDSLQSFEAYKKKHKIQAWMNSSFRTFITVNDIPYSGELLKGMVPNEKH